MKRIVLLIAIVCALASNDRLQAQTQLTEQQWKALDGYFQSTQNKDMVVRFTPGQGVLLAKLMWNNNEVHLTPESDVAFISKEAGDEGPIHIVFHKDSTTGVVDKVDVAHNGQWVRIKDYHPIEKKEMAHSPEQLKPFVGLYQLQGEATRYIQFMVKGNELILKQHWDDAREIPFVPESELSFFSRQIPQFTLAFTRDQQGNITQALAFGHDLWLKTKKPSLSAAQLKAYEGQFQSADDPDNQVRLVATSNGLRLTQLWDKKEVDLQALTDTYFYNAEPFFPLQITMGTDGKVQSLLLLGTQRFNPVRGQ
ncbi:MAG: hypothetical protein JST42_03710 [Bacteroidetes bacterium]|nr:hypothetical protein [Bacteroidota bacterium]